MIFCNLGSGSRGNSSYIECDGTSVLIDQGFSAIELTRRMQETGLHPESVKAIILTHDHHDHSKGIGVFARKYKTPVYLTEFTRNILPADLLKNVIVKTFTTGDTFHIANITFKSFHIPHDAVDPVGFIISSKDKHMAHLTDLGKPIQSVIYQLNSYSFDLVFLESNHDPEMLRTGPYPLKLQMRIKSRDGHLSNDQSLELLTKINQNGHLRHLVLGHLSEENNHPDLVRNIFQRYKTENNHNFQITIAKQTEPTNIIEL
ncbi:MAG: MBL fold metallo-hydrolase [Candidatus Marinimicrobia bacterium]|nr:MBL fold metallo-hydrolase [Candidatus Neomarinimicrobiota bacterium]